MKIGINITKPLMPGQYILDVDPARSVGIERVIFRHLEKKKNENSEDKEGPDT